jgi:hypothetical protein
MSEIRYRVLAGARDPGVVGLSFAEYKSTWQVALASFLIPFLDLRSGEATRQT